MQNVPKPYTLLVDSSRPVRGLWPVRGGGGRSASKTSQPKQQSLRKYMHICNAMWHPTTLPVVMCPDVAGLMHT